MGDTAILHCHFTMSVYTVILHCQSTLSLAVIGRHSLGIQYNLAVIAVIICRDQMCRPGLGMSHVNIKGSGGQYGLHFTDSEGSPVVAGVVSHGPWGHSGTT
jgi:hypothetical protein